MKKVKLIIVGIVALGLVSSATVYADGFAPAEGAYIGVFAGHGAGHVAAKVTATKFDGDGLGTTEKTQTSDITDGGLGLSGIEGGGWLGYGYKMGDLYVGFEVDGAAGGGEFKITSDDALETNDNDTESENLSEVSAEMQWSTGIAARLGYYINADTLFAIKGGIQAAQFDVKWADVSDTFYGGGARFGASIDSRLSAIDPNLSLRLDANYTDYMTAAVSGIGGIDNDSDASNDSEVSGATYNMRLGLIYSFFDVNSLF
jgi:hypothetical protein